MGVEVTIDKVQELYARLQTLLEQEVLVGIPESNDKRDDDPIGNAGIGYVMEFGSPAQNVPARPFLIPGVQAAEKPALNQLRKAAVAALEGKTDEVDQCLNAAGAVASNEVRKMIDSNIPPPLAPSTIRARKYSRGTKSRRESEEVYAGLVAKGVEAGAAQAETGIRTLINTGALLRAITFVIRRKRK